MATEKTIGLCCTTAHKEPVGPILENLAEKVSAGGKYRIIVFHSFDDLYNDTKYNLGAGSVFDMINFDMLDAMIIIPEKIQRKSIVDRIVSRCKEHNVPIITIDRGIEGDDSAHLVSFGYGEAFSRIVEHIMSHHGCRRIKLVAGMRDNDFSQTRIDSCAEVMAKYGVELKESDIMYGDFWETPTYAAMDEFFASGEPLPDAFICCNDTMAMAVCLKLNEKGYSVPDDVLVTGFDGIEIEKFHKPRLTTAIRDNNELSQAVIGLLDKICFGETAPSNIELDYTPVFSESCGCAGYDFAQRNRQLADFVQSYAYSRNFEEQMNSMENGIASDPSPQNAVNVIKNHIFDDTAVCITDEFYRCFAESGAADSDAAEQSRGERAYDKMRVFVSGFTDGRPIEGLEFPVSDILPQLDDSFGELRTLLILPLHFQDMVIGYYALPYSLYQHYLERIYTFTMSVDRSLEYMRTHERLSMLNRRLEFMFTHDHLTKIFNRYGFYSRFKEDFEKYSGEARDVFIVSVDLNDMKYINDNFGHSAGDDALCITANALTGAAEEGDTDIICSRFGGDEFVVAKICGGDSREQGDRYHAKFLKVLEELNKTSGKPFTVNASLGVYCASLTAVDNIDGLIELADRLMYSDKARHKRHPR